MIEDLKQVRDALELCRFSLEPYDDIKPRDWSTDRQNLRFAHEDAKKALSTLDRIIADQTQDARKMVVPDGYKLVPIEPTESVIDAIHDAISGDSEGYDGRMLDWYTKIYKSAMLSAAPPAQPEKLDVEALKKSDRRVDYPNGLSEQGVGRILGWNDCIEHLAATYDFVKKDRIKQQDELIKSLQSRISKLAQEAEQLRKERDELRAQRDALIAAYEDDNFLDAIESAKKVIENE